MEEVFLNACLAMIPLLSDFAAENSEKLSLIKTSICMFKLSNRAFNLFKHLPNKWLQWVWNPFVEDIMMHPLQLNLQKPQVDYWGRWKFTSRVSKKKKWIVSFYNWWMGWKRGINLLANASWLSFKSISCEVYFFQFFKYDPGNQAITTKLMRNLI